MILSCPRPDRRSVLAGLIAAPAVMAFGRARSDGADLFSLGVASGDPTPDGVVLWTRLTVDPLAADGSGGLSEPIPVRWEIAADEAFRQPVLAGEDVATADWAHSIHIEVSGLQPDRPYWYRFVAQGQQSPIGRTRTAPARDADLERLRFVVASCAHWERGYFSPYRHMADESPDLVVFLGDYIYEYSLGEDRAAEVVRPYGMGEATTLAGYRNRYALHRTDPDLRRLHGAAPWIVIWDDHEVQDDYSGVWSKVNGVSPVDFGRRRAAAYRAFYEHMPLRRNVLRGPGMEIYRSLSYGRLAQFVMMDGRQHRSRQPCSTGPEGGKGQVVADSTCLDRADPSRTFLGFEQETWVYDALRRSNARWNILAQDLVMAGLRMGSAGGAEPRYWTDTWDGFPAARNRFVRNLAAINPSNPVVLTGDYHSFWTNDVRLDSADPDSPVVATEFVGTSVTSSGPPHDALNAMLPENPQVKFLDARSRGYISADLDRRRLSTRYQAISDRRDPDATLSTLKSWVVETGRPGAVATDD
ncbi:MAG: alkaline phosphatase D family protein [Brevundimonas sp.]|uniref:alkaline phosphatase D family protein n=1 Tax=Brevundimonas sp. TaxID=1871086 RepID=UPI0025C644AA|nr:alkaline phosphatase D family protein [Brevundimonas sp.]MBX3476069.1 alkaline phosphatase D family protein [Brevundimonas sp.]